MLNGNACGEANQPVGVTEMLPCDLHGRRVLFAVESLELMTQRM